MQISQDLEDIIRYKHYPVDRTGFLFFVLISARSRDIEITPWEMQAYSF